jgi:putative hydrolase of the HAD superfamily
LHIITNGFQEIQDNKLKNSNIDHYFTTITNSEMAGVKKPNPKIYDYAITEAKASKSNSIMIGDCIDADVKGALNFGMQAILFNIDPSKSYDNIKQVSHLLELKNHL